MSGAGGGASHFDPPKFAQFETGPSGLAIEPAKSQVSDDALPPMPSWDSAAKKKIALQEEKDAMEMGDLDPSTGQKVPLMSGAGPISRTASPGHSPIPSPYGDRSDQHGYMGPNNLPPGASRGPAMGGAAMGAGAMAMGGRGTPHDPYARNSPGQYGPGPMGGRGGPNDQYGRGGPGGPGRGPYEGQYGNQGGRGGYGGPGQPISPMNGRGQNPFDQYNQNQGFQDQGFQDQGYQNNNPGAGGFGAVAAPYGQNQRQFSGDSGRPFPPSGPQRQYSNDSNRPLMGPGPGPQRGYPNNEQPQIPFAEDQYAAPQPIRAPARIPSPGFDFGTNDSRGPPQNAYGGNSGGRPSPPLGQQQQQSYDAYDRRPSPGHSPAPQHQQQQYGASSPTGHGLQRQDTGSYSIASTAPPTYASRSPPPQGQLPILPNPTAQAAYPGYKPYAPNQGQGRPGPPNRSNTGGNGWN
jgi:hypothetical protein